jgi:DNA-binding MarR family transcriptional regulator
MGAPVTETGERLADLLDRFGRIARALQFAHGLNPAQWECLRFIARVNCLSRTPSALAVLLGTTKGTASQTIIALESKGCVRRARTDEDRRVTRLEVTDVGQELLARDPLRCLEQAVQQLPAELAETLTEGLGRLAEGLQIPQGRREFGVCARCGHSRGATDDGGAHCGLKDTALPAEEAKRLCVNFCSDQAETQG